MARCPLLLIVAAACCAALAAPGPGPASAPAAAPAHAGAASAPSPQDTGEGAGRAKRYVAALARNGDLPFPARAQWHKKLHPAVSVHRGWQAAISPLGPLSNPAKRFAETSDEISDEALDEQLEAASRAEAAAAEALAAAAAALAAAEVADSAAAEAAEAEDSAAEDQEEWKRGIATLAKNGQLPQPDNRSAEQKRGGVAALARQGIRPGAPWPEKRSLAALARAGGLSALRYAGSKKNDMTSNSEKRASPPPSPDTLETLEALEALDRPLETPPMGWWGPVDNSWTDESKRHLGALRRQGRRRRDLLAADYDDLAPLPAAKRFLGRIPRLGRLRPSANGAGQASGLRRPHSQRAI